MKSSKCYITRKLLVTKAGKTIALWVLIFTLSACGASIGNSAVGTTGFMIEHNRKVGLLQTAFTPSDRASARSWEK